jgi:tetratricopeptide (TPR) repeat protein
VLLELNESALIYIQKEQFDNALLLLQKAHGVLDVVDMTRSSRDQMIALQLFYNMAMCYQKLGQLEECSLCLETCLEQLDSKLYESLKDKSISQRINKLKLESRIHLQLCAIYSQLHRHKNALE